MAYSAKGLITLGWLHWKLQLSNISCLCCLDNAFKIVVKLKPRIRLVI